MTLERCVKIVDDLRVFTGAGRRAATSGGGPLTGAWTGPLSAQYAQLSLPLLPLPSSFTQL